MRLPSVVVALSAALLLSATPVFARDAAIPGAVTQDGIEFGPQIQLTGVYFTNFENSRFVECASADVCATWPKLEQERLACRPDACSDLESHIRKLNGSHDRWGEFAITFIGRRSAHRSAKQFLGDTESKVLLERVVQLHLLKADPPAR